MYHELHCTHSSCSFMQMKATEVKSGVSVSQCKCLSIQISFIASHPVNCDLYSLNLINLSSWGIITSFYKCWIITSFYKCWNVELYLHLQVITGLVSSVNYLKVILVLISLTVEGYYVNMFLVLLMETITCTFLHRKFNIHSYILPIELFL